MYDRELQFTTIAYIVKDDEQGILKLLSKKLHSWYIQSCIAVPRPIIERGENVPVFNGDKSVMVETEPSVVTGSILISLAEGEVNCKGSAFCERIGSSCDDAYRKGIHSNTYSTYLEYVTGC